MIVNWIFSVKLQYLKTSNFVDLCVNKYCLFESLVLNNNAWKYLTVYKQMVNSK